MLLTRKWSPQTYSWLFVFGGRFIKSLQRGDEGVCVYKTFAFFKEVCRGFKTFSEGLLQFPETLRRSFATDAWLVYKSYTGLKGHGFRV